MDFIDLKTQQKRIIADLNENMQKVLAHGNYIMGPEIKELKRNWPPMSASNTPSAVPPAPTPCLWP